MSNYLDLYEGLSMKYAAIDIGTNAVLLLIMKKERGNTFTDLVDISAITRLGEGLKASGYLSEEAMQRTFFTLRNYKEVIERYNVDRLICVGTSALREAINRDLFVDQVEKWLHIPVRIVSPEEEAYYSFLSVRYDKKIVNYPFIIADVGGGSTEIIKADRDGLLSSISLATGSVKLTEMFIKNDPPSDKELCLLIDYLKGVIKIPFDGRDCTIIGMGGTATTLTSIAMGLRTFEKKKIHGHSITVAEIEEAIKMLRSMDSKGRSSISAMEKGREDIILQGIVLFKEILGYFQAFKMTVSTHGVRYGLIYEAARIEEGIPLF